MLASEEGTDLFVWLLIYLLLVPGGLMVVTWYQRKTKKKAQAVLATPDWNTFFAGLKTVVDPLIAKSKVLRGATPYYDQEYPSFYHHLYIPFRIETHERSCRAFAKLMKMFGWLGAGSLGFMCALSLFAATLIEADNWYIFILIGLLIAAICAISFGAFYYLIRCQYAELKLFQAMDEKLLSFGNGMEPYPYRVHVSQVLAYMDAQTFGRG